MDECFPAFIRDNKYFMLPFYYLAYRGKDIDTAMHFKSQVYQFSPEDYKVFYSGLNSISRNRQTDLNQQSLDFIAGQVRDSIRSIADIGCSSGYLLKHLQILYPDRYYAGCDIIDVPDDGDVDGGDATPLDDPYEVNLTCSADNTYDLVTCCHTLEHVIKLKQAVRELIRICRKTLIIVVPCQRYYYYTLDEHINFFTYKYQLQTLLDIDPERIERLEKLWGDRVLVVNCES